MLRLKELRQRNKLSQKQLAEQLGVTQATLSGWENEKYEIDNASLIKCCDCFNVSLDYLLGRDCNIGLESNAIARQRVNLLYEKQDYTIQDIENAFGVNYATFRSWCQGYGDYFNDKISVLANFFNCTTDYILGLSDTPDRPEKKDFDLPKYKYLNDIGKKRAEEFVNLLLLDDKYKKSPQNDMSETHYEMIAFGGQNTESTQPPIVEETT